MINRVEIKVNPELLANSPVNDEYLFRELACKMVTEMPVEELKKLIKFTKTDPNTSEAMAKVTDYRTPEHERNRLLMIKQQQVILYEAEVSLSDFG